MSTQPTPGATAEACARAAAKEIVPQARPIPPYDQFNYEEWLIRVDAKAAIITRHFAPLLARVAELEKQRHDALMRAEIAESDDRLDAWMKAGGRLIELSADLSIERETGLATALAVIEQLWTEHKQLAACAAAGLKEESK